jgi:Domain of unknown function (DUF4430)
VRRVRAGLVLVAAALLTGCGGGRAHGTARLWITRDEGAHVVLTATVPAGLTAMQALDREVKLETRYGGRYVQAIDGIEGSLTRERDWFYFVNGYEGDRSAAEYRLHPGDVEWWDYRSWRHRFRAPVVVGAFPEPFLHGYDGKRRVAVVVGPAGPETRRLAGLLGAGIVSTRADAPRGANVLEVVRSARTSFRASVAGAPGGPVTFVFRGDPRRLADGFARFRYEVP